MLKLLQWDLTGNCNLNCSYCREKTTMNLPELSFEEICLIIDKISKFGVKMVALAGGEPFLFPDLLKVLEYLHGKVETIGITTNGTLINENHLEMIKKYASGIQVSLDGSCAEVHDSIRGKGSFKKTVGALKMLVEHKIFTVTRLTICESNKHDVENYVRFAGDLGLKNVYLRRTIPSGNSANNKAIPALELKSIFQKAYSAGNSLGIHIGSADYFSQLYYDPVERAKAEKNLSDRPGEILSGCSIGVDALYLAQDGQVLFCPYLPVFCGDLKEQTLAEIWEKSEMLDVSRNLRWNKKGKCSKCKYLMCCGGCPAYCHLTTGDILSSDTGCWYNNE
jgi:AdoMet-dependent heme synthase